MVTFALGVVVGISLGTIFGAVLAMNPGESAPELLHDRERKLDAFRPQP
jgi:hypothetical protein